MFKFVLQCYLIQILLLLEPCEKSAPYILESTEVDGAQFKAENVLDPSSCKEWAKTKYPLNNSNLNVLKEKDIVYQKDVYIHLQDKSPYPELLV